MSYPVRRTTVYQIDFTCVLSGKRIASSKRRVRWRFGFANPEALAAGETGTACRGEEHDVTFVWSLTSGKRLVLADGQEVHYSSSRSTLFEFSWTMRGNHVLKIVAHAAPPMSTSPGFKQYDFFVDGQGFFTFPKLFRLGLPNNDQMRNTPGEVAQLAESGRRYRSDDRSRAQSDGNIANIEAPHSPDEEELYLQEAIRQSLNEAAGAKPPPEKNAPEPQADLLDFGAPAMEPVPALPPSTSGGPVQVPSNDPWGGGYSIQTNNEYAERDSYASTPPTYNQNYDTGFGSAPSSNPFGAPAGTSNPYAAAPPAPNPALGAMVPVSSNPYGASPFVPTASFPYNMPVDSTSNPYAATAASTPNPYSAPVASNLYGAPIPAANPYGAPPQATGSYGAASNPYSTTEDSGPATSGYSAPAPISTNLYGSHNMYGDIPPAVTPQAQQTPSTLGFGSPPADFGFSSPGLNYQETTMQNESERLQPSQTITMNSLTVPIDETNNEPSGSAKGSLDQAFSKLVNLDSFSVSSKADGKRANPFENSTIGGSRSLADLQKTKAPSKMDIMRTPAPPPGSMVISSNQTNSYASQYGIQVPTQQQQGSFGSQYGQQQTPMQQQYGAGMQQAQYGAPTMQNQQTQYGQPTPMHQPSPFGQQPQMQQPSQFGQQPQMQPQATYGQPSQTMQQQPPYGGPQQQFGQAHYGQPPVPQQQSFY